MKVTVIPIVIGTLGKSAKETGRIRNQKTSGDYRN